MPTPKELFEGKLAPGLEANADRAQEIGAVFQFNLTGDNAGQWVVDMNEPSIYEGTDEDADTTITMDSEDFIQMVEGDLPGPQAFMQGKLQIEGDMSLALQLQELFDMQS